MSQTETQAFLEDILVRFDPDVDLTDGGRAQTELITPILNRIGTDPFDEDVATFVIQRIQETHPNLAITELDALSDTLIDPMRVLFEAVAREIRLIKLRASIENVESLSDQEVDALMSNFFESRRGGGFALGVVRAFFANPISISATIANPAATRSGIRFFPSVPQQITAEQMLLNVSGSEFYFDINYTAEQRGTEYNVEPGDIISVANFPTATRVSNLRRFRGGITREDSLAFVARVQESQSDRTLTVQRGIIAEVTNNFPEVRQIQIIGYRDPEMNRDIVRGGGMGAILDDDSFGTQYGFDGIFQDDLDGDATTQYFDSATGQFISRIGSVGEISEEFYITIVYENTFFGVEVFQDVRVLEVLSNTRVKLDGEFIIGQSADWAIRRRRLTISDIPGGVTLPDTADGELLIEDDEVHIGGRTDVYLAGLLDETSSQIESLTDEVPLGRGFDAQTLATDLVTLNDITTAIFADVEVGMALALEEGVDADVYRIIQKVLPDKVRLPVVMTGTQSNLSWRIVDEIDTELTEPKEIRVDGSDLVVASGSTTVTTSGATNFVDANVQPDDVLRVVDDLTGGDYVVETVGAVTLEVDPPLLRTASGLSYSIFRASESVSTPVVRVRTIELLDSANAPVGTEVPYRDPVLASSRSFQNEASGFIYDGDAVVGLVGGAFTPTMVITGGSNDLDLNYYDPTAVYAGIVASSSITITAGSRTAQQVANDINADVTFNSRGNRAVVLTITGGGLDVVGIAGPDLIRVNPLGSINTTMGYSTDSVFASSNALVAATSPASLLDSRVRLGDLVEFIEGNNTGAARVIRRPDDSSPASTYDTVILGSGPFGPNGTDALYHNTLLLPDIEARIRIGRPSVGSARVYFLGPTSAEFRFAETTFTTVVADETLTYIPDPELKRTVIPAPPLTTLPVTGETSFGPSVDEFADTTTDFLALQLVPGDILEVLYRPIVGTSGIPTGSGWSVGFAGLTLIIRIGDSNPYITITFPLDGVTRDDVVEYINEQVDDDIASLGGGGELTLVANDSITIDPTSTVLGGADLLFLTGAPSTNAHPDAGEYIIRVVTDADTLVVADETPFSGAAITDTQYRVRRYVQRISSTEMNDNQDETQLYYADIF
jgi:hypothetical protein